MILGFFLRDDSSVLNAYEHWFATFLYYHLYTSGCKLERATYIISKKTLKDYKICRVQSKMKRKQLKPCARSYIDPLKYLYKICETSTSTTCGGLIVTQVFKHT
jgi:hypothetical protein